LSITLTLFALIGLVVFIFVPAAIFFSLEDWTYGEALYCCFITILTIGFADFVPGRLRVSVTARRGRILGVLESRSR